MLLGLFGFAEIPVSTRHDPDMGMESVRDTENCTWVWLFWRPDSEGNRSSFFVFMAVQLLGFPGDRTKEWGILFWVQRYCLAI